MYIYDVVIVDTSPLPRTTIFFSNYVSHHYYLFSKTNFLLIKLTTNVKSRNIHSCKIVLKSESVQDLDHERHGCYF